MMQKEVIKKGGHPKGMQDLVNSQVDINRAVFEANKCGRIKGGQYRPEYLKNCIDSAMKSLKEFIKKNK